MKHQMPTYPATPATTAPISVLNCSPSIQIDPQPLTSLFVDLGADRAEEAIYRALEDIARRLNELHAARCRCEFADMIRPARRLSGVADQIGLTEVAAASGHVATTAEQGDAIALEATLSRLERAYDGALSRIWDVEPGNTG